jgi:hypothetical protein
MKEAIEYLKSLGIRCDNDGRVISKLPEGERGIKIVDMLEENTMKDDYCYTIQHDMVVKIEL